MCEASPPEDSPSPEVPPEASPEVPPELSPDLLLRGYRVGAFPMARSRTGAIEWFRPDPRAIMPLDTFHVPKTLAKRVRSGRFRITSDRDFEGVVRACAAPRPRHPETWISEEIIRAYLRLHEMGYAHSVEAYLRPKPVESAVSPTFPAPAGADGDDQLAGGLYGVSIGGAFFGESMFTRATDASKVCLVHLVEHLRNRGYTLLDVQFTNAHLAQFGVEEVPCEVYLRRLEEAVQQPVKWA